MANMLTIHSVNPTGMFSYGLCSTISLLNKGLVHLVGINEDKGGDSNGSGKSSLFNAICELLFRENPTGEKGDSVVNATWKKGMAGRIYFTNWQGHHYRVTYCRNWKDASFYPSDNDNNISYVGTSLFFDRFDNNVWKDVRGKGMPDTHLKILEAINMTYSQFISISYMSHRIGNQFLRGTNKDRLDILSGITGIEEWDRILEQCRNKKKVLSAKITSISQSIAYEKGAIQTLHEQLQSAKAFNWENYIKSLEDKLKETRQKWADVNIESEDVNSRIEALRTQQTNSCDKFKIDNIKLSIESNSRELRKLEVEVSRPINVVDDPKLVFDYRNCANYIGQIQGTIKAYQTGSILDSSNCPTCGSAINDEIKQRILSTIDSYRQQEAQYQKSYANLGDLIKQDKEERLKREKENRALLNKQVDELRLTISDLNSQIVKETENYQRYEFEIKELSNSYYSLQNELNVHKSNGIQIKSQLENAKASLNNMKSLEGQIVEKNRQVKFFEEETKEIQDELDVYVWLIDNIPYIKLHKMSVSMKEISDLVNEYFDSMGETIRVRISSFEEKVNKKHAADIKDLMKAEAKIEIIDGSKNISPKLYSDGEISKVSLAVIRALHEKANSNGQGCNLMLFDEVFSFVDGYNSQKLAQSLSSFLNKGTVFLTDNSGSVNNLLSFDHVWHVRKRNGQTAVELD